jgi:predicted small integral membrane protein
MVDIEEKLSVNRQTLLTASDAQRLDWMAETEQRSVSDMMRVLLLESLYRWEKSAPGRRPRK